MIEGFYVAHFEKVSLEQFKKDMDSMIKSNMDNYNIITNYPINDVSFDEFCEECASFGIGRTFCVFNG